MLSLELAQGCGRETFYSSQYSIEARYPYRDRRLIEFVLAIPAYQFYSGGMYKHILRKSMQGILPEEIRTREGVLPCKPYTGAESNGKGRCWKNASTIPKRHGASTFARTGWRARS